MRPADLAPGGVEVVIGPPAIGGDDRFALAEQRFGFLAVARWRDPQRRRLLREGAPEETLLTRLLPPSLIDADHRRGPDRIAKPLLGLAKGRARAPDDRIDSADGDLQAEELR